MKLHTDFHDYYDNAVGYGVDNTVHYNRFIKEVVMRIEAKANIPNYNNAYLLGFCGKIYPLIKISRWEKSRYDCWFEDSEPLETYYAFSFEDGENKVNKWEKYSTGFEYSNAREKSDLKQFFIEWSFQDDEVFLEYKTPIWIVQLDTLRQKGFINPRLKDYGFERIKDSFTAFQEISMYLSNILVEQKEVANIEDKYRIEQHGFDLKTSFRKEKKG